MSAFFRRVFSEKGDRPSTLCSSATPGAWGLSPFSTIALFRSIADIISGIIAEISDQNAYRRHLDAQGTVHSPEQWRRFQDEHAAANSRRPRCC